MSLSSRLCQFTALAAFLCSNAVAQNQTLNGKLKNGSGYTVIILSENGEVRSAAVNSKGVFSFSKLPRNFTKNATLQLQDSTGQYAGPVVLRAAKNKAYTYLSGVLPRGQKGIALGELNLKSGYAQGGNKLLPALINSKRFVRATSTGIPLGAGKSGLVNTVATARGTFQKSTGSQPAGGDSDRDGTPDVFDVDDNGDLNLDATDATTASSTGRQNPFSTLYLGFSESLNANIASVTQSSIDAVISGANRFALIFFLPLEPNSTVTGAHVICNPSIPYCNPISGTAVYSGVSESSMDLRGQLWRDINTNRSGYPNLERISRGALVAGIQPRVGTSGFRPGDLFLIEYTNSSNQVVSRRTMSLPPYFVTVPAVRSFDTGSGAQQVDYTNPNTPGANSSSPIVLGSNGLLKLTFWRPQRQTIAGAESGSYRDMGRLHYGVIINGGSQEVTCAGLYSELSESLTENGAALPGGSFTSQSGAILWPLDDAASDGEPSASNVLSFTVNLKSCLARMGGSPNTYNVSLTAAGEQLSGGANRAAQTFAVTIP